MFKKLTLALLSLVLSLSLLTSISIFTVQYIFMDSEFNAEQIEKIPVKDTLILLAKSSGEVSAEGIELIEHRIEIPDKLESKFKEQLANFSSSITNYMNSDRDDFKLEMDFTQVKKVTTNLSTKQVLSQLPDKIAFADIVNPDEIERVQKGFEIARFVISNLPYILLFLATIALLVICRLDMKKGLKVTRKKLFGIGLIYAIGAYFLWEGKSDLGAQLGLTTDLFDSIINAYIERSFFVFALIGGVSLALFALSYLVNLHKEKAA